VGFEGGVGVVLWCWGGGVGVWGCGILGGGFGGLWGFVGGGGGLCLGLGWRVWFRVGHGIGVCVPYASPRLPPALSAHPKGPSKRKKNKEVH